MNETSDIWNIISDALTREGLYDHEPLFRQIVIAAACRGHVLVEGPSGTGKTRAAKLFAKRFGRGFTRFQFTSDALPADLLGTHIYDAKGQSFSFMQGPIFTDVLLADELNRAPARTQSALLEAMEERQVTIDGKPVPLAEQFMVVATQNPFDAEGTFPLPESQLDRFMFRHVVHYELKSTAVKILGALVTPPSPRAEPAPDALRGAIEKLAAEASGVRVDDSITESIAALLEESRSRPELTHGASIRGGIALIAGSRIAALLEGRGFVVPDDVKALAVAALAHRIGVSREAALDGITAEGCIESCMANVGFPR